MPFSNLKQINPTLLRGLASRQDRSSGTFFEFETARCLSYERKKFPPVWRVRRINAELQTETPRYRIFCVGVRSG